MDIGFPSVHSYMKNIFRYVLTKKYIQSNLISSRSVKDNDIKNDTFWEAIDKFILQQSMIP